MPAWVDQALFVAVAAGSLVYAIYLIKKGSRGVRPFLIPIAMLVSAVAACGPVSSPPKAPAFVVIVHNQDMTYPEPMTLSWWNGSTIAGVESATIPAGGSGTFVVGSVPDGLELDSTAYPAPGGQVWQTPDYAGFWIFHIEYPSGMTWKELQIQ